MPKKTKTADVVDAPLQFLGDSVAWAAWLYYIDGETQEGTAKRLGVSRATVGNLLNDAKDRGLVKISIDPDVLATGAFSKALCETYGLQDVLIIPQTQDDAPDGDDLRRQAGRCGALVLKSLIKSGDTLGVAWGRTMLEVGRALPRDPHEGVTVMQIAGSMLNDKQSSPEFCSAMIANRLGARLLGFSAPAVLSSAAMRDSLMQEPMLANFAQRLKTCDVVICGVGALREAKALGDEHFADPAMIQSYRDGGAVSILLGCFLDADGNEVEGPLSDRRIGISLADMRRAPTRLMVAAGVVKADALRAALRGGYCSHLIVDAETAPLLIAP